MHARTRSLTSIKHFQTRSMEFTSAATNLADLYLVSLLICPTISKFFRDLKKHYYIFTTHAAFGGDTAFELILIREWRICPLRSDFELTHSRKSGSARGGGAFLREHHVCAGNVGTRFASGRLQEETWR